MEEYCTNVQSNSVQKFGQGNRLTHNKNVSNVKECLTEYSLHDKVEALKSILAHNKKHLHDPPMQKSVNTKETNGVKECLQPEKKTPFQTLVLELKDTVMDSYWNKEVGKTRYQVANLPAGLDPLGTTFGRRHEHEDTVAEILNPRKTETALDDSTIRAMYRRSHNDYLPSEQINRNYEIPFNAYSCFGKRNDINSDGTRVKKLLTWINYDPVSLVNCIQADFMERTQSRVGEARNKEKMHLKANSVYGKPYKTEMYGVSVALSDRPADSEALLQQKYLQHVNTLRQRLKHRVPETPFLDIYEDLCSVDEKYTDFLSEDKVFGILANYGIHVDKLNFVPLLDVLGIRKEGNVNYKELVNLLNWKCDFPTLPKINKISTDCLHYKTTYETLGNMKEVDTSNIRAAGIPSTRWDLPYIIVPRGGIRADKENLGDQTSACSLLFPSIFTKSGLSHVDFFKIRRKEEMRSIFESTGIRFPENSFDLLWEEGLKEDCANGVCVETFRKLLEQSSAAVDETD